MVGGYHGNWNTVTKVILPKKGENFYLCRFFTVLFKDRPNIL